MEGMENDEQCDRKMKWRVMSRLVSLDGSNFFGSNLGSY